MTVMHHASDGSDESGRGLEITIRLAPDGRVYFADIPPDMLPVALAIVPDDDTLRARAERAASYRPEEPS